MSMGNNASFVLLSHFNSSSCHIHAQVVMRSMAFRCTTGVNWKPYTRVG